jgi:hypothetical protein
MPQLGQRNPKITRIEHGGKPSCWWVPSPSVLGCRRLATSSKVIGVAASAAAINRRGIPAAADSRPAFAEKLGASSLGASSLGASSLGASSLGASSLGAGPDWGRAVSAENRSGDGGLLGWGKDAVYPERNQKNSLQTFNTR